MLHHPQLRDLRVLHGIFLHWIHTDALLLYKLHQPNSVVGPSAEKWRGEEEEDRFLLVACRWVDFRNEVLQHEGGRDILFSGRPDNHGIGWISNRITAMVQVRSGVCCYVFCMCFEGDEMHSENKNSAWAGFDWPPNGALG